MFLVLGLLTNNDFCFSILYIVERKRLKSNVLFLLYENFKLFISFRFEIEYLFHLVE